MGRVLFDKMAFLRPQFFPVLTHEGDDTFLLVTVVESLRGVQNTHLGTEEIHSTGASCSLESP